MIPISTTAGAFTFTNPTAPALSYIARLAASSTLQGYVTIYDRLWHNVIGFAAGATAITHPGLTRWTGGDSVELWAEIYTAVTTSTTVTVTYTNQAGVTGKTTTFTMPASAPVGALIPIALASGDTGVRAVTNTSNAATMTAGSWGYVQVRDVASFPVAANTGVFMNVYDLGMGQIADNACLNMMFLLSTTTSPTVSGEFNIAQG